MILAAPVCCRLAFALAAFLAAATTGLAPPAAAEEQPVTLTLATATPGGGFALFGEAAAAAINAAGGGLELRTVPTRGSTENLDLLDRNEVDLALVQGAAAHEALAGIGRPASGARIIAAIYSSPGMAAVRADDPARSLTDLKGRPVAWGTRSSGLTLMSRQILQALSLDPDRDFAAHYLEKAGDGPQMVLDGKVDALWGGGIGWPGFTKLTSSGARLIGLSPDEIAMVTRTHPFLKPMTVPAGAYPGQSEPVATVGTWSFILARAGLSEDAAYRVAKALDTARPAIAAKLPQASETTPASTAAAADPDHLHSGAARYLREVGALR